jgi:hypothetical protein
MKRKIILKLIQLLAWMQQHLIEWLGDPVETRRPLRTVPRDRSLARPQRTTYVRARRGYGKIVDNYDNLPEDESIPREDITE